MNDSKPLLTREHLASLPAYRPARRPDQVAHQPGGAEPVRLAANEVPFGPLPGVTEAIGRAAQAAHRYPDMFTVELREALAERYGVDASQVVTGCGSVALCEHLAVATAAPREEVVFGWRSFEAYPILASRIDAVPVRVPNTVDHRLDIQRIIDSVTPATRLVFICSPNNPTGSLVSRDEMRQLLTEIPANVLIAMDEAYLEFVTAADAPDALALQAEHPNLVILRTFSKAWGLASLRLGYLIAPVPVAEAVRKVLTPFSTSAVAQAAGLAALAAEPEMRRRVGIIVAERERVISALRRHLPNIPGSQGNFCWLPVGERAGDLAERFEERGIIVRGYGMASAGASQHGGVRITIGTPEENNTLLAAAEKVLSR